MYRYISYSQWQLNLTHETWIFSCACLLQRQPTEPPNPATVGPLFFLLKIQIFGASAVELGRDVFPSDGRPVEDPGDAMVVMADMENPPEMECDSWEHHGKSLRHTE